MQHRVLAKYIPLSLLSGDCMVVLDVQGLQHAAGPSVVVGGAGTCSRSGVVVGGIHHGLRYIAADCS